MPTSLTTARPSPSDLLNVGPAFRSKEPRQHHRGMELAPPDILRGWTVLLYDSSDAETVMLRDWIASLGGTSIRITRVADAGPFIARHTGSRIALLLEARAEDLDARIEDCIALRADHPDCPIILMSESFGTNDFSTERMTVCDARLRSPVSLVAFKLGVPAALANNAYFKSRQASFAALSDDCAEAVPPTGEVAHDIEPGPNAAPAGPPLTSDPARPDPRDDAAGGMARSWKSRVATLCLTCGIGFALSAGAVFLF